MSNLDAQRWNARYNQERNDTFEQPRPFLLEQAEILPLEGLALDLAMGLGGNAGYLLQRGLRVIGVDVSEVAVRHARSRHPALMAAVADLNRFNLPEAAFDVVLNFYYLQRDLWPRIQRALRPGGLLIYETLLVDMRSIHPEIDPQYLLEHDELRQAFKDMQILVYREGWVQRDNSHSRAVASLVARKV
jgi:SAM-dependent methyltransferase